MGNKATWEEELILTYVPEYEELGLSWKEAVELAMDRDDEAAGQAILDKEAT